MSKSRHINSNLEKSATSARKASNNFVAFFGAVSFLGIGVVAAAIVAQLPEHLFERHRLIDADGITIAPSAIEKPAAEAYPIIISSVSPIDGETAPSCDLAAFKRLDGVRIYFGKNSPELSRPSIKKLNRIAENVRFCQGRDLTITGFVNAGEAASAEAASNLSKARATTVAEFLKLDGLIVPEGQVQTGDSGFFEVSANGGVRDRRVEITINTKLGLFKN